MEKEKEWYGGSDPWILIEALDIAIDQWILGIHPESCLFIGDENEIEIRRQFKHDICDARRLRKLFAKLKKKPLHEAHSELNRIFSEFAQRTSHKSGLVAVHTSEGP